MFHSGMALAMFVTVFIGFGRTFFLRPWFPEAEALAAPETLFHVHGAFFALTDVFVLAIAAWDFASRGRLHPVTLWGGLAIVASQPLRLMLSGTDAWLAFAAWAVS